MSAEDVSLSRFEESQNPADAGYQEEARDRRQKKLTIFSVFNPRGPHFVTGLLIGANVLVFVAMAVSGVNILEPGSQSLLNWGANFRPYTLSGQWWRLLTHFFVHIGILHLALNMYAFLYIGVLLEPLLGRARFVTAYFLTGLLAGLASIGWNAFTVSAGASGAIFGMYGVFLALLTTKLIDPSVRKPLLKNIGFFVLLNLSFGVTGIVDNAAHVGGLLSGMGIGYAYYPSLRRPWSKRLRYGTIALPLLLGMLISLGSYHMIPNDIGVYDQQMKKFSALESQALDVLAQFKDSSNGGQRNQLKEKELALWHENVKLINEMEKLHLPAEIHERNRKLLHYCQLRIEYSNLVIRALEESTEAYNDKIEAYNLQIAALTKELEDEQ